LGTQINRIEKEFILNTIFNKEIHLKVHGHKKEARFTIKSFNEDIIVLEKAEPHLITFKKGEELRIFASFQNNYLAFESRVNKKDEKCLYIENPDILCKNPQRKYERIKINELEVSFLIEGENIELDFPKTETFEMIEEPEYSDTFDQTNIVELIKASRDYLGTKSSENKIVMFRENKPTKFEEKLIVKSGKILWIPNTETDFPLNDSIFPGSIIVKKDIRNYLETTGTPNFLFRSEISNILYNKVKAGIFSEIYCPILYHEYTVGYIYLSNKMTKKEQLDKDILQYVYQFSKVVSYALKAHGYYKQKQSTQSHVSAPIIDISASGLLFTTQNKKLDQKIFLHKDIDLNITINQRKTKIGSRIMRKFKDSLNFYFAAQFLGIATNDFHFLFEFIYGKPFTHEDEIKWEGGAPSPFLKL